MPCHPSVIGQRGKPSTQPTTQLPDTLGAREYKEHLIQSPMLDDAGHVMSPGPTRQQNKACGRERCLPGAPRYLVLTGNIRPSQDRSRQLPAASSPKLRSNELATCSSAALSVGAAPFSNGVAVRAELDMMLTSRSARSSPSVADITTSLHFKKSRSKNIPLPFQISKAI